MNPAREPRSRLTVSRGHSAPVPWTPSATMVAVGNFFTLSSCCSLRFQALGRVSKWDHEALTAVGRPSLVLILFGSALPATKTCANEGSPKREDVGTQITPQMTSVHYPDALCVSVPQRCCNLQFWLYVMNYPNAQWLNTIMPCIRNLYRAQPGRFTFCPAVSGPQLGRLEYWG